MNAITLNPIGPSSLSDYYSNFPEQHVYKRQTTTKE